jgi:O-antigen/teichoic acid export membrane protein
MDSDATNTGPAPSHLRGLARSAASLGLLHATSMALTFVVGVLLARQLGPSGYGVYALAMTVATLVGMLTEFGLPVLAMREFAAAEARQSWGEARGLLHWADRVILGLSAVLLACFFAAALLFDFAARSAFLATMLWAVILVPVVGFAKLRGLALLSLGRTFAGQFAVLVLRPGLFAMALAILWLMPGRLGPAQAMIWQVVAAAAALLTVATFFHRYRPAALTSAAPVTRTRQWLVAAIPMGMSEGLRLLQGQMATLLLSVLATTAAVGLFRVADSAAAICLVPITILNVVACPYFSRLHAAGDKLELQRVVTAVSVGTFLCVLAVSLSFAFFARPLLALAFGVEFAPSAPAFQVLLLGNVIATTLGPAVSLANMTGNEKMVTIGTGIAVLAVTFCCLLLVPLFGSTGAAVSVAAALIVWNGILATIVRLRLGIDCSIFSFGIEDRAAVARITRNLLRDAGSRRARNTI